jgi:hypothetical protein
MICYELQRQVQIFVTLWKSLKALRVCVPLSYYAEGQGKRPVNALTPTPRARTLLGLDWRRNLTASEYYPSEENLTCC